jgi:hypothetical protein
VKITGLTTTARLLWPVAATVFLVACTDQHFTAPPAAARKVSSNNVSVSSEVTLIDPKTGKTRSFTVMQELKSTTRGGAAYASLAAPTRVMGITDSSAVAAGFTQPLTPVVAVSTGMAAGNINLNVTDTTTHKIYRVVATGPMIYNYPIDVAYFYNSAGYMIGETHYRWTPVTGGYALLAQKEVSYSSAGVQTASVISNVISPATYAMGESPSITARFGSLFAGISCYFTPRTAYAQGRERSASAPTIPRYYVPSPSAICSGRAGVLGLNIGAIAWESATGVLEPVMIPVYLGSWVSLGHSLWDYLNCLNTLPRCDPKLCTGGGGTTW